MKPCLLFLLVILITSTVYGQRFKCTLQFKDYQTIISAKPQHPYTPTTAEICGNGIDDDSNGLADMKDFSCFFNNVASDTCIPTTVIWGVTFGKLYWVDIEANTNRILNFPGNELFYDIAWTPNGKLYGNLANSNKIMEINPYTAGTHEVDSLEGYYGSNGMTSDASGDLYIAAVTTGSTWHIIKLNLITGQITLITSLSAYGLVSAGDLTFLNGFLYATCDNSIIAKIDVGSGNVQTYVVTGPYTNFPPHDNGLGLITLGDGYLYANGNIKLFRIDPTTMVSSLYYTFPPTGPVYGLTAYSEFCNASGCRPRVSITVESSAPYCSTTGVQLTGNGRGIASSAVYEWMLPNGQTATGDTYSAFQSGTYKLRYHTTPDTCGAIDSVNLAITQPPFIWLGNDTMLCAGASNIIIAPQQIQNVASYSWQNGSATTQFVATEPGVYWTRANNVCGTTTDSIQVFPGSPPKANLGTDEELCNGSAIVLSNEATQISAAAYRWSTNQRTENISVSQPGVYWLEATNTCGTARDSVLITAKDTCNCTPLLPRVDLGADFELCDNDTKQIFNALHNPSFKYTWQDGSHFASYTATSPGTYWAQVSTLCGEVTDTVTISRKTDGCICSVFLPSAFTPDNNGKNDTYKPLFECPIIGSLQIFNRWGSLVYETSDLKKGWDGIYKKTPQPGGTYVYYIRYRYLSTQFEHRKKGAFVLIR